jgi:hypothetical protein
MLRLNRPALSTPWGDVAPILTGPWSQELVRTASILESPFIDRIAVSVTSQKSNVFWLDRAASLNQCRLQSSDSFQAVPL